MYPTATRLGSTYVLEPGEDTKHLGFGESVALWADPDAPGRTLLFVGCPRRWRGKGKLAGVEPSDGLVHIFERQGSDAWQLFGTLTCPQGTNVAGEENNFGSALAVYDDVLAVAGISAHQGFYQIAQSGATAVTLYDIKKVKDSKNALIVELDWPEHGALGTRDGVNTCVALGEHTVAVADSTNQHFTVTWTKDANGKWDPAAKTVFSSSKGPAKYQELAGSASGGRVYFPTGVAVVNVDGQKERVAISAGALLNRQDKDPKKHILEDGVWTFDPTAPNPALKALPKPKTPAGTRASYGNSVVAGRHSGDLYVGGGRGGADFAHVIRYRWNNGSYKAAVAAEDAVYGGSHLGRALAMHEELDGNNDTRAWLAIPGASGNAAYFVDYHSNRVGDLSKARLHASKTRISRFGPLEYDKPPPAVKPPGTPYFGWVCAVLPNLLVFTSSHAGSSAPGGAVFTVDVLDLEHPITH